MDSIDYNYFFDHISSIENIALVTTGRTGSDFLHSLVDSHSEVLTFNGHFLIYSEYFAQSKILNIKTVTSEDIVDELIGFYIYKLKSKYDIQEAKDCLGEYGNESIDIDTMLFRKHMVGFLNGRSLNTRNILLSIYGSYALCLEQDLVKKKIIFHHPHLKSELIKLLKDFPDCKLLFTTRDPRENILSHIENFRKFYPTHDNQQHVYNCLKIAFEDVEIAVSLGLDFLAVKLEDIPREEIMMSLSKWLGIHFETELLRSTWAGKDWHGDRISNKVFKSTGWQKGRTYNNWKARLSWRDKYIFNFLMNCQLIDYDYEYNPIRIVDYFLIPILLVLPMSFETRFFNFNYLISSLKSGGIVRRQALLFPIFYLKRISLLYFYYGRILKNYSYKRYILR